MTVFFLRTTSVPSTSDSLSKRFAAAVSNTGNYFFEEALEAHLVDVNVVYRWDDLPEALDTLVLSMSNFISPSTNLVHFCDQIEKRDIARIVMVGAGAQAYDYGDEITLQPGTLRFLKTLSERSISIGVRGYFTAEVLNEMGIKNVEIIGCPTAFWIDRSAVRYRPAAEKLRIAIHCTPTGQFRDKIGALLSHGMRYDADYIVQSEKWILPLMDENYSDQREELRTDNTAAYYARGFMAPEHLREWLAAKSRIFFEMREWIDAMESYDFVYGSRFHGNMAAIQAGTPALNMPFDTRTRELCEYLNLPHIPLNEFDRETSVEALQQAADFSFFEATYPSKLANYLSFLTRNGLSVNPMPIPATQKSRIDRKSRVAQSTAQALTRDASCVNLAPGRLAQELRLRLREERSEEIRKRVERGEF